MLSNPEARNVIPNRWRGFTAATAFAVAIGASGGIKTPSLESLYDREPNPDQITGIFAYGHRESDAMLATGNIADGFRPIDGKEFGEKDVELMYEKLREWKEAGIDFVAFSWHSITNRYGERDVRDKFFDFFLNNVMQRCDNPYPELKITVIYEPDSTMKSVSEAMRDQHMKHFADHYFSNPRFLKNKNGQSVFFVFAQEMEGIIDNPGYIQGWSETADKHNLFIILEDYIGSNLNPHYNDPNIGFFNYASNFLQVFPPSRLDITDDVARVTISYSKPGDLKRLEYNEDDFGLAVDEGMASDAPYFMIVSDNEAIENSGKNSRIVRILNEKLLRRRAERMSLIDGQSACQVPPEENVVYLNPAGEKSA